MFHPILTLIYGVVIGFGIGMAVYRNNAKKFKKIEEALREKGRGISDIIK